MSPLEFLLSLERLGMKFGLENMRTICAALDHPERAFASVIIAGTNGKGSVTAMTSAVLHAAGVRSARYTSPHLERLEERFVIDERQVSANEVEAVAARVQQVVEALVAARRLEALPTFFECTTAIAFELFRRASVELAAVEVGLGGRLDATNVLNPMAAAITSIDFDHQELLGDTIAAIAQEKAGVIRPGIPVVVGPVPEEAAAVIMKVCRELDARYVSAAEAEPLASPALAGAHQRINGAIATCLMKELQKLDVPITDPAIATGLAAVRWPGRLEWFHWRGSDVLIDAAHNPAGARALAAYLAEIGWRDVTMVLGVMGDKDATGIVRPLLAHARAVICATAPTPRAMPGRDLAALVASMAGATMDVSAVPDPAAALTAACRDGARVVAAGSIFLIGPLRGILR